MVATMDLSEARGLVLFRVVRRGIGISRRLSVTDTLCAYRRLGCSPSNPSVSRTNRPPPEKESGGDGKGSSPETLKRLVLLVSQRRSFLPSSILLLPDLGMTTRGMVGVTSPLRVLSNGQAEN